MQNARKRQKTLFMLPFFNQNISFYQRELRFGYNLGALLQTLNINLQQRNQNHVVRAQP